MAENYSLNSRFGLNVSSQGAKSQQTQNIGAQASRKIADLFDTVGGFVGKYENVFSGQVEHEINMYSRQSMFVAMNLKSAQPKHKLDLNI